MDKDDKSTPAPNLPRVGQDEINLTEFPIALLSDRTPRGNPAIRRFTNGDKVWEIVGDADNGLPTRLDMEVYVVLTELTREQGFPERVQFSQHDLLRRLGWSTAAHRYARLQQALDSWVGVTIRTTNSFYDKAKGEWLTRHAFHLLEEYHIAERRGRDLSERDQEPPLSWSRWSDTIRRNMQARYLKPLDVELFLTFRSAVTQALYRYLDAKRLNGKPTFQQSLVDLGKQHLGLPASYYPSQIKRELDAAHEELIATGFLAGAHYEPMRGGSGEKVVYRFGPKPAAAAPLSPAVTLLSDLTSEPQDPLLQQLLEHGITAGIAAELVAARREECERQLAYLPYRAKLQNPAGALRRAIEEAWPAPRGLAAGPAEAPLSAPARPRGGRPRPRAGGRPRGDLRRLVGRPLRGGAGGGRPGGGRADAGPDLSGRAAPGPPSRRPRAFLPRAAPPAPGQGKRYVRIANRPETAYLCAAVMAAAPKGRRSAAGWCARGMANRRTLARPTSDNNPSVRHGLITEWPGSLPLRALYGHRGASGGPSGGTM